MSKMEQSEISARLLTTHTLHVGAAVNEMETLNEMLRSFWELESLGIKQPNQCKLAKFDKAQEWPLPSFAAMEGCAPCPS